MKSSARRYISLICASFVFAIALDAFLLPARIASGGFSGIAVILNVLFKFPIGITVILLNIPFLILNKRHSSRGYIARAAVGVILTGTLSEFLSGIGSPLESRMFNAVIGGALTGVSMGTILALGYTTGGTDLAAALLTLRIKRLKLSSALFLCDAVVICAAFIVMGDIAGSLLALLSIAVQAFIIDLIVKRATP